MVEADLRRRLEAALLDALAHAGPDALNRGAVLRPFAGQGTSTRTLYRWTADFLDSGRAGQALARRVEATAAARAARAPDPAGDVVREVGAAMPKLVRPDTLVGGGPISIMDHLATAIRVSYDVMSYARTPEGAVRNAKLLLAASDKLRQSLDTALRVSQAMAGLAQVDRFHAAIVAELRLESPALAERVVARLNRVASEWGPA